MPVTEVQKSSGTVSSIEGSATVRDTDAQVRQLAVGDEINVGDVIVTASSSSVQVDCHSEASFIVPAATEFLASEECFFFEGDASENEVASETLAAIDQTLEGERDLLEILRERGDEGPGFGDLIGDNGHTFIRLGRILLTLSEGNTSDEEELLAILEDVVGQADSAEQPSVLVSILGEYNIVEGESSGAFVVLINRSPEAVVSDITVSLNYSGVAQDGVDFNGVASVVIPAGSNGVTFTLDTIDDALAEGLEAFTITIGTITDANFEAIAADPAASSVTNTIVDEAAPGPEDTALVSIAGEYEITEGETSGEFTVSVNQATGDVTSDITVALTYSGVAEDGTDFTGVAEVTIAAGTNSTTFTVDTLDDALAEGSESLIITLGEITDTNFEAIAADPAASRVENTIVDEAAPGPEDTALVSIAGEYEITEGETSGEFTVSVNQATGDVTSDITVALTYSGVAEDGTDFTGVAEVTIAAGTNSTTFTIDTLDDALAEGSESLIITLGEITDTNFEAIAADPAASRVTNAIVDETDPDAPNPPDTAYELRLFAVVQVEGTDESPEFEYVSANEIAEDGGVGTYVVLAVDENGDPLADADQPGGTVTVNVGGGTDTADRGVDYASAATVAATVGTTFTISAIDDVLADSGELFTLSLSEDWSRADEFEGVAYSGPVTTTIHDETDNDPEVPEDNDSVTLSIAGPASVLEGETTTDYTLSLVDADGNAIVAETDVVVTVTYTGTATDGSDYTSETPITIAAGASSATFDLATLDDAIAENDETIVLTISTSDDGGFESLELGDAEITTVIIDDEVVPPAAVDDVAETSVDSSVIIGVTANDSDPDGSLDLGSIIITELPSNGTVVVSADGTVTYTPNEGYVGPDTFQYTIADNDGAVSNAANVAIQVSDGRETAAFTDNWVNGVEYYAYATEEDYLQGNDPVASGLTGDRLDENGDPIMGSFSWADGEFVVFKIGDVIVAEFLAEQLTGDILFIHDIAGLALSNTNADQLENTAIFLQALDADLTDGDLTDGLSTNSTSNSDEAFTNGINISEEVRDAFAGYLDPTTGEPLDLQEAGKVMISNALAELGIEFTRESEADPNPDDAGGNENVFETLAIQHVMETVSALADTVAAGERLADTFQFDDRQEDVIVAGNGEIRYSSEQLDTEDGDPATARISFNAAGLVANATPQQVAVVENMEIEIPEGTEAIITLADGTTRVVGTVIYDDETREGYIQLEAFVGGDGETPDRGISNAEVEAGLLQDGGISFNYTLWDWTASTTVSLDTLDTFKAALTVDYENVVEGDLIEMRVTSSLTFDSDQSLTLTISPEIAGSNFAEYADDFLVPLEYSADGGQTWQPMLQVGTYEDPAYDLPLPVFGFVLPAGSDNVLIRIQTFDDVFDEDPAGPPDQVEIDGQLQGVEVIDLTIRGDRFFTENVQPGIIDNDPPLNPYVKSDFQIVYEDDGEAVFTITLYDNEGNEVAATEDIVISYETTDLGAIAGEDYVAVSGQVVIEAGSSSATVSVPIIDDNIIENPDPEFAALTLTGISGAYSGDDVVIGDPQGSLRIYDNDQGSFAISDVQVIEGVGAVVTVTRYGAGPADSDQTVDISTVTPDDEIDTASEGDFRENATTLIFTPGQITATFVIETVDDAFVEATETFRVELSNPTGGAQIRDGIRDQVEDGGEASVAIVDNDTLELSLADVTVSESDGGTATITASLDNAPESDLVVTLSNGATITFAVGATSATSTAFAIQGDDVYLDGETLTLTASVTSGGSEFENLTLDPSVDVVVSDTISPVTVDLSATETVAESGTITYTATLTGGVANNAITVTLANGEVITIAAGDASGTVDVAAPVDDGYVTAAITNSIASAVEANAGTAGALENLVVAGDTSVSTDVTENDTETAISLVDLAVDEGSGTASVTATIANAPMDGPVVVTLDNGATITFAVGATSATSTAFAIQGDDVYLDGETLTLTASVTSGGSEFENLTLDPSVDVVVSDTISPVTVDLSATETVAESGTITYTATLTGGVANNAITVTLANGEVITIAAGDASGTVDVAAPVDDGYVTAAITNSIASAVEANAGTAGALENLVVAGDTSVSTDVTENDTETAISLVDLAVDEGSGTASVTATIANAPMDGPVVVTLDNGATITFAVGATSATSTAFAIQGDDVYLDGETLTLTASVTSGGSEFENLTLDPSVDVVVSDTISPVTVDLSATETVAESGTITYTATLTGGVANNAITVTLANGEVITIAAGDASGTVDVAAPVDDGYVTAAITNSIASAVEANAGTAGALENLVVAGDTSVSTDVTENDTETAISLVDLAVDEGSGTASVTATIANAPMDGPVVVTLDNGATITFAVGATSATSTAFAIQGDDVYLDGETLTLTASVTSGGSEFENLTLDPSVDVVVSDTISPVTVDLSATASTSEDGGSITYTASLEDGAGNAVTTANAITVTLDNGETITIAENASSGDSAAVAVNRDDVYVESDAISNAITSVSEANAGTAGAFENLGFDDTPVSTTITDDVDAVTVVLSATASTSEDGGSITYTASLEDGAGNAVTTANAITVTLDNGETITIAENASSGDSAAVAVNRDDVYVESDAISNAITSVSEANAGTAGAFENLGFDDTPVSTTITDDSDASTATLSSALVGDEDGATVTYTVTLSTAPTTDETFTFDVDGVERTITVLQGQTTGSTTVDYTDADVFIDVETVGIASNFAGSDADGASNYESLTLTNNATGETLADTIDDTTLTLNDVTVSESDGGTATITASLDNAPETELIVTLSNGATITFAAGAMTATSTAFAINNDEDVYVDDSSFELSVSSTSGGNFESLVTTDTAMVTVNDTIDTTTVTLTAETVDDDAQSDDDDDDDAQSDDDDDDDAQSDDDDDDDAQSDDDDDDDAQSDDDDDSDDDDQSHDDEITILVTAEVDNTPETDLIMTLSTGAIITILADQTVGSVEVTTTEDALPISIVSTTGGNYESLNTDDTAILSTPLPAAISHAVFRAVTDDGQELIVKVGLWEADATDATAPIAEYAAVEAYLASQNVTAMVQSHVVVAGAYASGGGIFHEDGSLIESEDIAGSWFAPAWNGESFGNALVDYRIGFVNLPDAPVAIDLDGDGVEYLSVDQGVTFEDQGSGETTKTAWVAGDDGILVIDANNSGTVDETAEYVFTEWSDDAQTDLEAIAQAFDTNQDGVLDAQDERFDQFAVWQDRDSDGVTDEGELTSLTDLGIESIELSYRSDSERRVEGDGDVTVFGQANVNYQDGSTTIAEDASFAVEAADLLSEDDDLLELLSDGGEEPVISRAEATEVDIAQLELTLNFEHNESDSFDQNE